jgi:hypothetical protein
LFACLKGELAEVIQVLFLPLLELFVVFLDLARVELLHLHPPSIPSLPIEKPRFRYQAMYNTFTLPKGGILYIPGRLKAKLIFNRGLY